jgi:hypothetical protein
MLLDVQHDKSSNHHDSYHHPHHHSHNPATDKVAITMSHDVMARLTCHLAECGLYMTKKDRHTIVAGLI